MGSPKTLTVDETARELGICRPAAYRGIRNGEIPSIRVGKRILVPREALKRLLATGSTQRETAGSRAGPEPAA